MPDSPPAGAVSGLAVGVAAVGGLLVWSAIRNVSPVDTLKEVLGKPDGSPAPISTPFGSTTSGIRRLAKSITSPEAPPRAGVAGSVEGGRLVEEARKLIGVPYVWAAASPTGVDCSGLVVLCLRRLGLANVPRFTTYTFGAWASAQGAVRVKPENFAAGDVIIRTGHMGIAVSNTRLIHAARRGTNVTEAAIYDRANWWGWRLGGGVSV